MQSIANSLLQLEVTPTVTAGAYSAGQQVGGLQTLDRPCIDQNRFAMLAALCIIDKANQKAAFTIFLFNDAPTVGSDNAAVNISSADLVSKCQGFITIASGDWQTCKAATNAVAFKSFSDVTFIRSLNVNAKIYAVPVTTGTPTYASTSDLTFKWIFAREF